MWVRIRVQMQARLEALVNNGASASPVTNTPTSTGTGAERKSRNITVNDQLEQLRYCP
jgi:hypothetical protein